MEIKNLIKQGLEKNRASTDGKLKMSLQDVCDRWPNGFKIDNLDFVGNQEKTYLVIFPKEDVNSYFFAGSDLTRIISDLVKQLELTSITELNKLISDEDIKFKLVKITTSNGHYFFKTQIVD